MDANLLSQLINMGLALFLVMGGALFFALRVYPDWTVRDAEQRSRHYETDMKSFETDNLMSQAILALSSAVARCPFQQPPGND